MSITEKIANLGSFDLQMNPPCQYQKKQIEWSMKNVDNDAGV